MAYLEELLPEFRKGAKIRIKDWDKGRCIKCIGLFASDDNNQVYFIKPEELTSDDWEFYQEPIDWDYIIKNKCLCFFWYDYESNVKIGTLKDYNSYNEEYIMNTGDNEAGTVYNYCRPVSRDEITFYEERNND